MVDRRIETTDRVAQINWLNELAANIAQNLGTGTAAELVEYALSDEGRETWGIEIPEWFDEHDRRQLVKLVGENLDPLPLWVIEFQGRSVPSVETTPEFPESRVIVADTHFVVVAATHNETQQMIAGYPYWMNIGHPADGRWLGANGETVYIVDGEIIEDRIEAWKRLGLKLQDLGAETWDQVDPELVYDHIKTF